MAGQVFSGTVKSFNPNKGWGFVECAESKQLFGSDVFLLKNELQGFGVAKGDRVAFSVQQSPKGIQATNVKVLSASGAQSFFGEVKSFNPQKGFGFIASPASQQIFGKDVFVLKSEFSGGVVQPGAQVQFKAKMGERGPMAEEVQLLGASMAIQQWTGGWPQWGGFPQWGGAGMQLWGGGASQWGGPWGGGLPGARRAPSESEVFFGTLKGINAERGWGHVSCQAMQKLYGKDMFVMKSNLESVSVQPGQAVCFTVAQGPKGPHATNIRPFPGQAEGQVYTGTVKSYNESKGWGFIESEAAKSIFQTDIFLHKRELNEHSPGVGDRLQFTVDCAGGRAAAKGAAPVPGA